jgi:hypothetical protein
MDRPKLSTAIRSCHCVHNCVAFPMSVSYSLDHEIIPLPGTGRELWGHQNVTLWKGYHKGVSQVIGKYLLGCIYQDGICLSRVGEIYSGPTRYSISYTICKHVINEFNHRVILDCGTSKEYLLWTRLN